MANRRAASVLAMKRGRQSLAVVSLVYLKKSLKTVSYGVFQEMA
jgi:hypothetical protein